MGQIVIYAPDDTYMNMASRLIQSFVLTRMGEENCEKLDKTNIEDNCLSQNKINFIGKFMCNQIRL